MPEPRQRKQRGAAQADAADSIPLAQPNRDAPASHTLLDVASERSDASHAKNKRPPPKKNFVRQTDDLYSIRGAPQEIGPLGEAIAYALSLSMIHFTLDVLVHSQFAEHVEWGAIAIRAAIGFGILLLFVYNLHHRADAWWAQLLFLVGSITAGCYLIRVSSRYSYLAGLKQAPPLGTLWVWCVLEQRVEVALTGLMVVGGYFWWGEFSIFS